MWHRAPQPRVPDEIRLYAVGDIHGRLDLLEQLLHRIDQDAVTAPDKTIIRLFVGDYVDRGPQSAAVIERLLQLQQEQPNSVFLRGNHEQLMLQFLEAPSCYPRWRALGGEETLQSYNVTPPIFEDEATLAKTCGALKRALPPSHLSFLNATELSHISGDYLFVHAGIRPGTFLADQKAQDMLWIREEFLSSNQAFEKFVVHGHSPTGKPEVRKNRIGIDTRAFRTGRLTALRLDGGARRFLTAERPA
jgi:serine/threonine protein phosphatase 1